MSDAENLEKILQLMKDIAAEKIKASQLSRGEREDVAALSNLLLQQESTTNKLIQQYNRKIQAARSNQKEELALQLEQEKKLYDFIQRKRQAEGNALKQSAEEARKNNDIQIRDRKDAQDKLENNVKASFDRQSSSYRASNVLLKKVQEAQLAALGNLATKMNVNTKKAGAGVQNVFGEIIKGSGGLGGKVVKIGGELLGEVIGMGADVLEGQADTISTATKNIVKDLDTQYRNFRKTIGFGLKESQAAFLAVMDDEAELAQRFNNNAAAARAGLKMISDIYIDPSDAAAAMKELAQGVSTFSEVMKATPDIGAAMANNVAALGRLGISQQATAKTMEIGSKAMSMNGIEMIKLTRQVVATGLAIDKDLNQVMADFNTMAPQLTQFGENMTTVFAKLEAQSKATGIAAGDLLNTAMKFDTFEGAAQAAGKLNAILGDTVVDTMALIHASPDEKIEMLRQSLDDAGKSFDDMHRREQQVIATSLGLGSVMEAQKLFNEENADAYESYASNFEKGIDTSKTQDQIKELAKSTATINDVLEGAASNMASTINVATSALRATAETIYKTFTGTTDTVRGLAGSSDTASKAAIQQAKAADKVQESNKKLKSSYDNLKGAAPTPTAAKVPSPKEAPKGIIETLMPAPKKAVDPSEISKAQALAFQDRTAILAQAQAGVRNVENAMKMFGDINAPGGQSLEKKATVAVTMLQDEMKEVVKDLSKNLGVSMEEAFKIGMDLELFAPALAASANIIENLAKQEKTGPAEAGIPIARMVEMLKAEKTVPEAIPMVREFETLKTKTLDSTVHMEKITLLQEIQKESNDQVTKNMQELVQFVKENQKVADAGADVKTLTLRLGQREFAAVVEDSLKMLR